MLGVFVSHWTVTPGGAPSANIDDAVSWISSVGDGGGGEVAESEPFSDGVDIDHKTLAKLFSLQNWQSFLHSPTLN